MEGSQSTQSILEELREKGINLDEVDQAILISVISSPGASSPHSCAIKSALEYALGRRLYEERVLVIDK